MDIAVANIMPKLQKQKLKQVVDLLKFILTSDDEEINQATLESVIEILEEEISED